MNLTAHLFDDDGRLLITLGKSDVDFAPHITKWENSYFAATHEVEWRDIITCEYHHVSFEDFSPLSDVARERAACAEIAKAVYNEETTWSDSHAAVARIILERIKLRSATAQP